MGTIKAIERCLTNFYTNGASGVRRQPCTPRAAIILTLSALIGFSSAIAATNAAAASQPPLFAGAGSPRTERVTELPGVVGVGGWSLGTMYDYPTKWGFLIARTSDPLKWFGVVTGGHLGLLGCFVGGGSKSLFFITSPELAWPGHRAGCALVSLSSNGRWHFIRRTGSLPVAFCSSRVGVFSMGQNLVLTRDGGESFMPLPPMLKKSGETIADLWWVTRQDLLVNTNTSEWSLWRLSDNGSFSRVWKRQFAGFPDFHAFGWAGDGKICLQTRGGVTTLSMRSGKTLWKLQAAPKPIKNPTNAQFLQIAADDFTEFPMPQGVICWSKSKGLSLLIPGGHPGGGTRLRVPLATAPIMTAPLGHGRFLLVAGGGKTYLLDRRIAVLQPVSVSLTGPSPAPWDHLAPPTPAEVATLAKLLKQVPNSAMYKIVKAIDAGDWHTPQARVALINKGLRQWLAANRPKK